MAKKIVFHGYTVEEVMRLGSGCFDGNFYLMADNRWQQIQITKEKPQSDPNVRENLYLCKPSPFTADLVWEGDLSPVNLAKDPLSLTCECGCDKPCTTCSK